VVDDLIVTIVSWEYPIDFLVIYYRDPMKGNPVILGRPWLATANAFIGCRAGDMCISHGTSMKTLMLYPPTQPVEETLWWLEDPYEDENLEEPLLSLGQERALHEQTKDNVLTQIFSSTVCVNFPQTFSQFDHIFSEEYQTHYDPSASTSASVIFSIDEQQESHVIPFPIIPGKLLLINSGLTLEQQGQLVNILLSLKSVP